MSAPTTRPANHMLSTRKAVLRCLEQGFRGPRGDPNELLLPWGPHTAGRRHHPLQGLSLCYSQSVAGKSCALSMLKSEALTPHDARRWAGIASCLSLCFLSCKMGIRSLPKPVYPGRTGDSNCDPKSVAVPPSPTTAAPQHQAEGMCC